ncbi:MAG: citrate lyase acyl carrier protein [Erysipelothrix sp.]|nr:citrate lyase acyl carrier protein [Erysipelothrix sp.]
MKIMKPAQAGSLLSNDVYIQLYPNEYNRIDIDLKSVVIKQFKNAILKVLYDTLAAYDVTSCRLVVQDQGALDHVLKARLESAIIRSLEP